MSRHLTLVMPERFSQPTTILPLAEVPEEVRQEVEDAYAQLKAAGAGARIRATFDNKAELDQYVSHVVAYCAQRPQGAIRFRKSPTRKSDTFNPETMMDYRITDVKTPEEEATEQVKAATAKVTPITAPAFSGTATPAKAATGRRRR